MEIPLPHVVDQMFSFFNSAIKTGIADHLLCCSLYFVCTIRLRKMCFACGMYQINLPSHGRIPCSPTRLIAPEAKWDFGYITLDIEVHGVCFSSLMQMDVCISQICFVLDTL
jgi:hypothetical protein